MSFDTGIYGQSCYNKILKSFLLSFCYIAITGSSFNLIPYKEVENQRTNLLLNCTYTYQPPSLHFLIQTVYLSLSFTSLLVNNASLRHIYLRDSLPPTPIVCVIFRSSVKTRVFSKLFQMCFKAKKVNFIFEEPLNLHTIVGQLFFSSVVDSRRKQSQAEETISFKLQSEVGKQYPTYTEYTCYFLISNCSNASNFLN